MRRAVVAITLILAPPHPVSAEPDDPGVLRLALAPIEDRSGAIIDWYPGAAGFRVSGGMRDTLEQGRRVSRRGAFAPYIGLGWQGQLLDGRVLIGLDFGALYQGRPDVRMSQAATSVLPPPQIQEFRFQPMISFNFIYRF